MARWLPMLARSAGVKKAPEPAVPQDGAIVPLAAFYDDEVEARVQDVYQRDYMIFGYRRWRR
jgi:hypothetical protein